MADPIAVREGPRASRTASRGRWLAVLVVAALAATLLLARCMRAQTPASPRRATSPRAVPVVGVAARSGDLGVYQNGLGTVTPVKTVSVRSRVDGELVSVNYREGQFVRAGELLAQIDPRPFEVQLHQAEGQLAKDEAALQNAQDRPRALQDPCSPRA